jgi:hypothetical protein
VLGERDARFGEHADLERVLRVADADAHERGVGRGVDSGGNRDDRPGERAIGVCVG